MKYTIHVRAPFLTVSPPIVDADTGESIKEILYTTRHGEVGEIKGEHEALITLYDFHQTHNALKDGDTFTWRGKPKPFAIVEDVDIRPLYMLKSYHTK